MYARRPRLKLSNLFAVFVLGGFLAWGFFQLAGSTDGQPTCNGKVLSPGDSCIVIDNEGSHTDTYEDRVQQANSEAKARPFLEALAGIGSLLFFGAGIWMIVSYRRKAAAYEAAEAQERRRQNQYS